MHINTCDCAFMQGSEEWQNQAVIGCHISYRHMATGALLFMRSMLRLDQARYRRTCPHPPHSLTPRGTVTPSFRPNISLKIIFPSHISFFSAEIELWELWTWKVRVFTSRDDSQWETARGRHPEIKKSPGEPEPVLPVPQPYRSASNSSCSSGSTIDPERTIQTWAEEHNYISLDDFIGNPSIL